MVSSIILRLVLLVLHARGCDGMATSFTRPLDEVGACIDDDLALAAKEKASVAPGAVSRTKQRAPLSKTFDEAITVFFWL